MKINKTSQFQVALRALVDHATTSSGHPDYALARALETTFNEFQKSKENAERSAALLHYGSELNGGDIVIVLAGLLKTKDGFCPICDLQSECIGRLAYSINKFYAVLDMLTKSGALVIKWESGMHWVGLAELSDARFLELKQHFLA